MSYSQLGQDEYVLRLLGYQRNGFFLDSGAADGLRASNTVLLERDYDWDGICVEPDDEFFDALTHNRRSKNVQCCLYDRGDEVEFVEAGTLGGVLEDYHPQLLAHACRVMSVPSRPDGSARTVLKQARTVRSVLESCDAPQVIDYWSLDTEGSELRILESFPFDRYRVRVLTVEHNRYPVRLEIRDFLESLGYVLVRDFDIDDCYAEPAIIDVAQLGRRRRPGQTSANRRWR